MVTIPIDWVHKHPKETLTTKRYVLNADSTPNISERVKFIHRITGIGFTQETSYILEQHGCELYYDSDDFEQDLRTAGKIMLTIPPKFEYSFTNVVSKRPKDVNILIFPVAQAFLKEWEYAIYTTQREKRHYYAGISKRDTNFVERCSWFRIHRIRDRS